MRRLTIKGSSIEGLTRLPSRPHLPAGGRRPGVGPSSIHLVRLSVKPRRFWREFCNDGKCVALKIALLAALLLGAGLLEVVR